jgi:hypothetical protein
MEKENKILEILDLVQEKVLSPDEALPQILLLFRVGKANCWLILFNGCRKNMKCKKFMRCTRC